VERLTPPSIALLLWAALAIGSALTLGALNTSPSHGWAKARQTAGIMLLAWGVALVLGAAQGGSNPLRPLSVTSSNASDATAAPTFQEVD
ncbi:hypothetical protein R0J92_23195, partial [Tritonibacter sp. SIMBA_163]